MILRAAYVKQWQYPALIREITKSRDAIIFVAFADDDIISSDRVVY